ncbi:hypothetical protein C8Q74DRAFT_705249 [Fomes fomentarius]|nr:hypothetical protein C8Q74DRAFT_705249 [Fomes fomentarius]
MECLTARSLLLGVLSTMTDHPSLTMATISPSYQLAPEGPLRLCAYYDRCRLGVLPNVFPPFSSGRLEPRFHSLLRALLNTEFLC